jgi:uncharacterized membrane protein YfcA
MQYDLLFWFLAVLSAIFVGLGKGGLPVVAALAVPTLSLGMPTIAAASLLLPVYIVSDIFALVAYRKDFEKDVLKISFIGMTIGVVVGWGTAHLLIEWVVTLLIGLMGAIFASSLLWKKNIDAQSFELLSHKKGYFWCTVAGFTSFISHNGGPPWQIFTLPLRLPKTVFVGTSVIAFSYCNAIKLVPYYFLGQIGFESFKLVFYLMIPASISVYLGVIIVKLIPENLFFNIVAYALFFISLKLIWDGLSVPLGATK